MRRTFTEENLAKLIPPQPSSYETFSASAVFTDGIIVIPADFSDLACVTHLGVEYARKSGVPLHLHIIEPMQREGETLTFPLILFVQGSAWFKQNTGLSLIQLGRFARRGFVVAIVEYRPSTLAPFPAQIKDTKTAIRFMIKHAAAYHVDPERILLWGDSSGGHTVVMAGVTLDNPTLDDESPTNDPISLKAVIDYYGPSDVSKMCQEPSTMDHVAPDSPEGMLIGGMNVLENPERVRPTVPMTYISPERAIPPILILHGDKDRLVPFGQSVMLFEALKKAGQVTECYQVKGADHGGAPFWTEAVLDIVEAFVRKYV
ncbi:MAG: alpha/beta hydrolase [Anaerolineae bacterium]|nr:alpha/beta hydrolase [Anaerolineae bacterium]